MLSKFLEKKVEIILDGFSPKEENSLELEYYLLESDCAGDEEKGFQKAYGVEIVKKHKGLLNERKKFENVSCSRQTTQNLVELLAANTVTPSTLPYILDDLIGQ
jgi:hypothetical protein